MKATLKSMAAIVKRYKTDAGIHQLARNVTHGCPPQNLPGASACYITTTQHFVRDQIRYVHDVEGVETLQSPDYTLRIAAGDCDDKSILVNTLLASLGYQTYFFAIGIDGQPYSHVMGGVLLGTRKIPLETILPGKEPGWMAPNASPVLPWKI